MAEEEKVEVRRKEEEDEVDDEDEEEKRRLEEEKRVRKEAVKKRKEEMKRKAEERLKKERALREEDDEEEEEIVRTPKSSKKSSSSSPAPTLREELVNSSVNFLNHPKVKPSPLSQKMAFLQKKGLTQEEIQEALNRANASSPAPASPVSAFPQANNTVQAPGPYAPVIYQPPPPLPPAPVPWYGGTFGFIATAVACVGTGVGMALLAQKYLLSSKSDQEEKKEKEVEKKVEDKKVLDEVTSALKEMQTQNGELKELVKGFLGQNASSPQNGAKTATVTEQLQKIEIAELKADLKKLKAMMVDNISSKSYGQSTTPLGWSPSSEPKLPPWMEKDSGKNPLSFDDPYSRMLEKAQNRGSTGEGSSTTTLEEEPRPKEFGKILQMVQNGQIPDDVKSINDKPLDPNYKIERGQRQAPLKPWQKNFPTSETTVSEPADNAPRVEEINDDKDKKDAPQV